MVPQKSLIKDASRVGRKIFTPAFEIKLRKGASSIGRITAHKHTNLILVNRTIEGQLSALSKCYCGLSYYYDLFHDLSET